MLHPPSFEVLNRSAPVADFHGKFFSDRIAEARQTTILLPIAEKWFTQAMTSDFEVATTGRRGINGREGLPGRVIHFEHSGAKPPGHHPETAVILEPITLKPLHRPDPVFHHLFSLGGNRVAEHRQAAIGLPVGPNRPADTIAGLRKTTLILGTGHAGNEQHCQGQQSAGQHYHEAVRRWTLHEASLNSYPDSKWRSRSPDQAGASGYQYRTCLLY